MKIRESSFFLILCLSDIHLGIDDSYGQFKSNRRYLHNFLSKLRFSPNLKELVFNGDLFDQWFIPGDIDTLCGKSSLNFLERIVENNREIINDIRNIIADKEIKVTYRNKLYISWNKSSKGFLWIRFLYSRRFA